MVKLDNLLQEGGYRQEQIIRVKNIKTTPLSNDGKKYARVQDVKTTLKNSALNNIQIDNTENQRVIRQSKDAFQGKTYISDSDKLKVHCANHPDRLVKNVNVKDMNDMLRRNAINSKSGDLNPCDIESGMIKDANKNPRGQSPDSKRGNLDSSAEAVTYNTIRDFIQKNPKIFDGFVLHPTESGYGQKHKILINGKKREIDVYLQYPNHIAEAFGQKGLGFIIDGPTHYGPSMLRTTFEADSERNYAQDYHLARIEVVGGKKKEIRDREKESVEKWVNENMEKLSNLISDGKRLKTAHEFSRSSGELSSGRVEQRKKKKALVASSLSRLIQYLQSVEPSTGRATNTYTNDQVIYNSSKYGEEMKLSDFLKPGNPKSDYKGKVSYELYPDLWKELIQATPEETKAWKEKHQAKNGEKLFSKDKDGNVKLFENKESSV